MKRATLAELGARHHDLLVIGGGIVGCGIARDAALRGLRVALVERDDFGSGTTSRSTRLIHGGLRYLELFDFGLVREDLREREILLRVAPHLVHPLPFLVPMYRLSPYQQARLKAGMVIYDLLSFDKSLPGHHFLSRAATLRAEPNLDPDGLQGAAGFYDAQVDFPERLCLENALAAAAHGALLRNHTKAGRLVVEGGAAVGAEVRDTLTGEQATIRARLTIAATGAWLDRTLERIQGPARPLLRTTKGVHLVAPRVNGYGVVLSARSDRRIFFVVPWRGMSLIGTTDTDERDPPHASRPERADVRYLLEETRRAFPAVAGLQPFFAMAGVRALVRKDKVRASDVSRRHALYDGEAIGGPRGLLAVAGGKITAYRGIAEDAVDRVCRALGTHAPSTTARRPLPGAPPDRAALESATRQAAEGLGLNAEQALYLVAQYGQRAREVVRLAGCSAELRERVCPEQPTIAAEVVHAAREEAAVTLGDVLLRRTPLGLSPGQGLGPAPRVAAILGRELEWSAEREADEVERYRRTIETLYALPG